MKTRTLAALLLLAALGACKKKQPENIPRPKAEPPAQAAAVSTAPAVDQNPLTAPGNYLKTTVGQIQKAKDAKALYEATEKKNLDGLNLSDTGGN